MEIKKTSYLKNESIDRAWLMSWSSELEKLNGRIYSKHEVITSLGRTHVWGLNTFESDLEVLVIFPGARTTSLFWDLDKGLDHLQKRFKIYLVETNGLPNLSEGKTPDIRSLDYGKWASEIFDQLNIRSAYVAGASFGGLICMKLSIVSPEKVKAIFLLNPGCLQPFSMSLKNLYYNLLPIILPNKKNISKFLNKAVFCKPLHQLSTEAEKLVIDYELFALTRYKDHTQKPYYMGDELQKVTTDTYLLEGSHDLLFPYETSIKNAKSQIHSLKKVIVFDNVGHGIETYHRALQKISDIIVNYTYNTQKYDPKEVEKVL